MRKHIATLSDNTDAIRIPIMNLSDANEAIEAERVCRTCTKDRDHCWTLTHEDIMALLRVGEEPQTHGCHPSRTHSRYKLVNNGTIVDIDFRDPEKLMPTEALVSSCGWEQTDRCTRCAHFQAHTVQVWREAYENGPLRPRNMVVGGFCGLPADAKCQPKPIVGRKLDPSCANCKFLYGTHSWHYSEDFNRTVGDIELDPWVRKHAILAAYGHLDADEAKKIGIDYGSFEPRGKASIGLAIFLARLHTHKRLGNSGITHRRARVVDIVWQKPADGVVMNGVDECALLAAEYVVQFDVTDSRMYRIDARRDDVLVTMLSAGRGHQAMITFYGEPVLREFNLHWAERRPVTDWSHLGDINKADIFAPRPDYPERWWSRCVDCKKTPGRACYFHAKNIERKYKSLTNIFDYEIEIVDPAGSDRPSRHMADEFKLVYVRDANGIASDITTLTGDAPNALTWQLNERNLHQLALEAWSRNNLSLWQVFWRVNARMPAPPKTAKVQFMQPGLGKEITEVEPMKYYCAINRHYPDVHDTTFNKIYPGRGIDLRLMLGDRFGMERGSVEYSDSWTRKDDEGEWLRAHSQEERISEEIDTTMNYEKLRRNEVAHVKRHVEDSEIEWRTVRLDLDNKPVDNPNYWSDEYDPEYDQREFVEWLDEYDEESGTSNRMAKFGYSIFKGPDEGMYANERDDEIDRPVEFMCITCDARYAIESMGMYETICTRLVGSKDHNGVPKLCRGRLVLRTHVQEEETTRQNVRNRAAPDMPARRRTGREGAVLADSRFFQERNRLARITCPWWELKGSSDLDPTNMSHLGYDVVSLRSEWQGHTTTTKGDSASRDGYAYFAYSTELETRRYRMYQVGEHMWNRGDFYAAAAMINYIMKMW